MRVKIMSKYEYCRVIMIDLTCGVITLFNTM